MLFVVPGVIAFAVDFYNGTIFLPSSNYGKIDPGRGDELLAVMVDGALSQESVEGVVSDHIGQRVELRPGRYRSGRLASLGRFWPQAWQLRDPLS